MPRISCITAAVAAFTSSVSADFTVITDGVPSYPEPKAKKHIAGVPVLNYDQAYQGLTQSTSIFSEKGKLDSAMGKEDWIVAMKPGTAAERIHAMCSQAGDKCTRVGPHSGFPFISLSGTEADVASVVGVESDIARFIEVDTLVYPDPIEPAVAQVGASSLGSWGLSRIGVNKTTVKGRGVNVYVLDTGVRFDHDDFGGRAFGFSDMFINTSNNETSQSGLCVDAALSNCSIDYHGHGTHCAGTVAGATYGVAPEATIWAGKVLSDQGPGSRAGILLGISNVITDGLRPAVISMSLGGSRTPGETLYDDAIDAAIDVGIVVVIAAGNSYYDACNFAPAYVPAAITVGATDSNDMRSGFSNFGTCVDIWAPGTAITSADGRGVPNGGTNLTNGTWTISGTSMACPHVAGAVALWFEIDPSMAPANMLLALKDNSSVNYITELSPDDINEFLYVGTDAPEPPLPAKPTDNWPTSEFFESCKAKGQSGNPNYPYKTCMCSNRADRNTNGTYCYQDGAIGCDIGEAMEEYGLEVGVNFSHWYFLWNCSTCECLTAEEIDALTPTPPDEGPGLLIIVAGVVVVLVIVICVYMSMSSGSSSEVELQTNEEA